MNIYASLLILCGASVSRVRARAYAVARHCEFKHAGCRLRCAARFQTALATVQQYGLNELDDMSCALWFEKTRRPLRVGCSFPIPSPSGFGATSG